MSRPGGAVTVRAARNASRPRATVPGTKPPGIRAREGHLQSATHSCVTYGPPDWKTRIGEDVTSRILDRVQGATKKNTLETPVLQRYAEIVPSVNRTAVL